MKLSKSILSPTSHVRHDPPLSLPTSLSRRLKANGSIKGGQSPATFPTTTGKKRGPGFDNPEPSSPKVTCIGQVKMKTKKKVRQTGNLSNRRSDISLRKLEEEKGFFIQNQRSSSVHLQRQDHRRWVHLPLTIYEALREFTCLFPCRSSCFSRNKGNGSREVGDNNGQRRCRDVVARWLVTLQEGEAEEKSREIELMVTNNGKEEEEDEDEKEKMEERMRSSWRRRNVFEGIEFNDHGDDSAELKEEKTRVPKNALLLMRCRSDPMKMADIFDTRKETDEEEKKEIRENIKCKVLEESSASVQENEENPEAVEVMEMDIETRSINDEEKLKLTPEIKPLVVNSIEQVAESTVDETNNQLEEDSSIQNFSEEEEDERFKSIINKVIEETLLLEHIDREDATQNHHDHQKEEEAKSDAAMSDPKKNEIEKQHNQSILPDCLLLMMCEPKLSMEVSRETWVCTSTELKQAKTVKKKKTTKKEISEVIDKSKQHLLLQPPRSSCSFPVTGVLPAMSSMATMIEQKLVNSVAYEPLVLTRCKSEPMRTAATAVKVAPETCFWNNRKIEPHRRATFGFGAAGVGF